MSGPPVTAPTNPGDGSSAADPHGAGSSAVDSLGAGSSAVDVESSHAPTEMAIDKAKSSHNTAEMKSLAPLATNPDSIPGDGSSAVDSVGSGSVADVESSHGPTDMAIDKAESSHGAADITAIDKAGERVVEKAGEGENLLCVVLCDFLFDTPKVPRETWTERICDRVTKALKRCRPDAELARQTDGKTIDIRGEYIRSAIPHFLRGLHETSLIASVDPSVRCLNVIVGCMKHGCGKGLLKAEVLWWLDKEKDVVKWDVINNGSVISIKLTGEEKFKFLQHKFEM